MFPLDVLPLGSGRMDTIGAIDCAYVYAPVRVRDVYGAPASTLNPRILSAVLTVALSSEVVTDSASRSGQAGRGFGADSVKVCCSSQ